MVLTGGASVGAYDVVRDVLTGAGGTFRHVRVQPGKPQGWAWWRGVPVVSLPGNPLSASLSYELFVRPLVDRMLGRPGPGWLPAVAGAAPGTGAARLGPRLLRTLSAPGPWLMALGFFCYSGQWLAVVGFLPTIYSQAGVGGAAAGMWTG